MTPPLPPLSRRGFVQSLAMLAPGLAAGGCAEPAPAAVPPLDEALLVPLAEALLPTELGAEGARAAALAFAAWAGEFEPVAELNHGYGTGEIEYTAADPLPAWAAQLRALDLVARRREGGAFGALPLERRRALVRRELARQSGDALPPPAEAGHVALGLLAHWFSTPEALDRCHGARIGRYGCRPLAHSPLRPTSLEGA